MELLVHSQTSTVQQFFYPSWRIKKLTRPWSYGLYPQTICPAPLNWYTVSKVVQWLLSSGIRNVKETLLPHRHVHVTPRGTWPWWCICTRQEDSSEIELEWNRLAVTEDWCPQYSSGAYYTRGHVLVALRENDHDGAHPQLHRTWLCVTRSSRCRIPAFAWFQEHWLHLWVRQCGPTCKWPWYLQVKIGSINFTLQHIYRPRLVQ